MRKSNRWYVLVLWMIVLLGASLFVAYAQSNTGDGATGFVTNTPASQNAFPLVPTQTAFASPTSQATATDEPTATTPPTATLTPTIQPTPIQIFEPDECLYVEGQSASEACIELIERYSSFQLSSIQLDTNTLTQYSFWRVGPQAVTTYDAPGGNPIGQIPAGFNFVNVIGQVEGWLQSEDGAWLSIEQSSSYFVEASQFTGVLLPDGWNQPFGWVLDTTGIYTSLYPGGPSTEESGLIPLRYQQYSIFAEAKDPEGWTWYMIGPNQWIKQIYMTVIKPIERPEGVYGRWVAVDLFEQSLVAYEDDKPVFATLISSGLPEWSTNEGTFEVWARLARDSMSGATGAPDAYALQSVPWVMYFDESISLHGTYWHDLFGYRRSHGCVNLSISDARWVFEWMLGDQEDDPEGITNYVYVHSSDAYRD